MEGTGGNAHCVWMFPKELCTCPSRSKCYHIMAVRISIGLGVNNDKPKKTINFTKLKKNTRSKKDKTSGRKVPHIGDYDVIAAPDSIMSTSVSCRCS